MREELIKYSEAPKYSCLLMGQRGLDMDKDAIELASLILKTADTKLQRHPDFMLVDTGNNKVIGVDVVSEVIRKASLVPALADKIVVVIKNFDKLTEQAQNMLLKLIEESQTVLIIGTCYQDNILNTIKSRCTVFNYKPYTKNQFEKYCEDNQISDASLLFYLTNGCPGLCNENPELLDVFREVIAVCESGNYSDLLGKLHLLEEKDKDNFYTKYPSHVRNILRILLEHFQKKWIQEPHNRNYKEICNTIDENARRCGELSYTKDNFFYCIAQIITGGN